MTHWGIVSTIKAPAQDILRFAAYHLERGAHRLFLYLDAPSDAEAVLAAHPKIRATLTDEIYWAKSKRGRPEMHQSRQFHNARHAYGRALDVAWLAHIDVDEFLAPQSDIGTTLARLPASCLCARVRPVEGLAGSADLFKAFHLDHKARRQAVARLYPTFGEYVRAGFLSHVAGKLLYRTGLEGLKVKIHNVLLDGEENPGEVHLRDIDLCHLHARDWPSWSAHFAYRHAKGSYRPELRGSGPMSAHDFFNALLAEEGDAGLRAFFDEVVAATPAHVEALRNEGLLRHHALDLDDAVERQFSAL